MNQSIIQTSGRELQAGVSNRWALMFIVGFPVFQLTDPMNSYCPMKHNLVTDGHILLAKYSCILVCYAQDCTFTLLKGNIHVRVLSGFRLPENNSPLLNHNFTSHQVHLSICPSRFHCFLKTESPSHNFSVAKKKKLPSGPPFILVS